MSEREVAEALGTLIALGLVEAVSEDGKTVRYRLAGIPVDDEQETRRIPARRVQHVEAASGLQITG
jgi:DNA-binding transcriptional ArsR family regulator